MRNVARPHQRDGVAWVSRVASPSWDRMSPKQEVEAAVDSPSYPFHDIHPPIHLEMTSICALDIEVKAIQRV